VGFLIQRSRESVVDYKMAAPRVRSDVTQWPGMIPGSGVLNIRKNAEGKLINRHPGLYRLNVTLTVLGNSSGGQMTVDVANKAEKKFWIVDDSRTGVYAYDSQTVYVAFDELQRLLNMTARTYTDVDTGKEATDPARATDIHVKLKGTPADADLKRVRADIQQIVHGVMARHMGPIELAESMPFVETWREDKATYIDAIEHEKLLVTILFGIISLVAVFLIFCIFYMIVVEKTKDIGIIKSVGATAQGVAGIFLGYGLAIGLVGGGLGLLAAFLITRYINEIHAWLGRRLGVQVWNPEVYLFDKIPNTMNPREVTIIVSCAILSALLGAVIPALRAARMNPVEALRWE
jgi:lipoprotein-releasing system permease protein